MRLKIEGKVDVAQVKFGDTVIGKTLNSPHKRFNKNLAQSDQGIT